MATNRNEYKNKYLKDNYDRVLLCLDKGDKDKIKEYADSCGESVNSFIKRAIKEAIEHDKQEEREHQKEITSAPTPYTEHYYSPEYQSIIYDKAQQIDRCTFDLYKFLNAYIGSISYSLLIDKIEPFLEKDQMDIDLEKIIENEPIPEEHARSLFVGVLDYIEEIYYKVQELKQYVDFEELESDDYRAYMEKHSLMSENDDEEDDDIDFDDEIAVAIIIERIHEMIECANNGERFLDYLG